MSEHIIPRLISGKLGITENQVNNTIKLLSKGDTIPFIARYRKEATQSLDEVQISQINQEWKALNELIKRKNYILDTIQEQGQLTTQLRQKIDNCWDASKLEDYYLPFKKKRNTRAEKAKKLGLEPLANLIQQQNERQLLIKAKSFVKADTKNIEEALQGARDIIAERINEESHARDLIRKLFKLEALIEATVIQKKKEEASKYKDYFDYTEPANKAPSHRVLAVFRGETEGFLRCKLTIDNSKAEFKLQRYFIKNNANRDCEKQIKLAIEDALKRLLLPSLENEFRNIVKEKADKEAIDVFTENLKQLLLAAPLGSKRIMGIDPGFRTGCKLVCLDENGNLLHYDTIYPHPPQNKLSEAHEKVLAAAKKYKIEAISIGNGTAGKETFNVVRSLRFENEPEIFLVNEDGASIYSASEIAREEFPNLDLTVRGAVSIARRLSDPLSELVKIDPKSIGVGQYQHDVNQSLLRDSLGECVEHCVNSVGVNLNTASEHLLKYIAGLGPVTAGNIVNYRKENGSFKSIKTLTKVPRLGSKAFEQCAGFLRIRDGKNILDNTGVHPERYELVQQIVKDHGKRIEDIISDEKQLKSIKLDNYTNSEVGLPTLQDIIKELSKPGFDIRGKAETFEFTAGIESIDDVRPGMYVKGIINNITKFGAFVDIGIKEAGLIHISQMADRYVDDPLKVVKLNQKVSAKVLDVDLFRKRISLSLKE